MKNRIAVIFALFPLLFVSLGFNLMGDSAVESSNVDTVSAFESNVPAGVGECGYFRNQGLLHRNGLIHPDYCTPPAIESSVYRYESVLPVSVESVIHRLPGFTRYPARVIVEETRGTSGDTDENGSPVADNPASESDDSTCDSGCAEDDKDHNRPGTGKTDSESRDETNKTPSTRIICP